MLRRRRGGRCSSATLPPLVGRGSSPPSHLPVHSVRTHQTHSFCGGVFHTCAGAAGLRRVTLCFARSGEDLHCKPGVSSQALMAYDSFCIGTSTRNHRLNSHLSFSRLSSESGNYSRVRDDVRLRGGLEINTVTHICSPSVRPASSFTSSPPPPPAVCWPPSFWGG